MMKVVFSIQRILLAALMAVVFVNTRAADISHTDHNVAIEGYDPVGYFAESRAIKGDSNISYAWGGVTWYFTSQKNKDLFLVSPEKYVPQFGGYCANGLSDGHKIEGNPLYWRIIDGKLYLYFSRQGREQWEGKVKPLIDSANETWLDLRKD